MGVVWTGREGVGIGENFELRAENDGAKGSGADCKVIEEVRSRRVFRVGCCVR